MSKKISLIILLLGQLFLACEKKELPPSSEAKGPSLFVQGKLNGTNFYYGAGEENVTANTIYSEHQFEDTIRTWTCTFSQSTVPKIEFNMSQLIKGADPLLLSLRKLIQPTAYQYLEFPNLPTIDGVIDITFVDEAQEIYTTAITIQPQESYFELSNIEEVVMNGLTYLQAEVHFSCIAVNPLNSSTISANGTGVIVFGGI